MNIKYVPKSMIIFICIVFPILLTIFILEYTGLLILSLKGFALDSNRNLYIGKESEILVITNGQITNHISALTSRSYTFTINENDTIILATAGELFHIDLEGNIVSKQTDEQLVQYRKLQKNRNIFIERDGTKYKLKNTLGYFRIIRINGTKKDTIYRISTVAYLAKLLQNVIYISIFIVVPFFIYKWRKNAGVSLILSLKRKNNYNRNDDHGETRVGIDS